VRQDFREKASGARPDRRELLKLLKDLTPGDVMAVTRIDRIARSTSDLFAIVKQTWTRAGNSARWRSHGRHATNTGRLKIAVLGGRRLHRCRGATWRRPCSP
jgi:DNA invertase Pin-like site-specific DNA recombinase